MGLHATWKEGILPLLLKDLMSQVQCQHRWLVIDCELDSSWAENMQSLLDENQFLTIANSERIYLAPHTSVIMEMRSLRYGAPSAVARVSVLHAMQILDWENSVEEWIADCDILLNRRDCVRTLMKQYVPMILHEIEHEVKTVVPVCAAGLVQTLCRLLGENSQMSASY